MIQEDTLTKLKLAKLASRKLCLSLESEKNEALTFIHDEIYKNIDLILSANKQDLEEGKKNQLTNALLDRLALNNKRILGMLAGIKKIILQPDPTNNVFESWVHENGMKIEKVSVPLGVVCVIYEARPNVTTDAVALCLKSGNAVVLRGSQHAFYTNKAVVSAIKNALLKSKISSDVVQFIELKEREESIKILESKEYVDLIIPRGGEELKNFVLKNTKIPVIGAGGGTCHLFIDKNANERMAIEIAVNAKTQRPGVCNAVETILIHKDIATSILPKLESALKELNVEIVGCSKTVECASVKEACEEDWSKEYLDLKVSIKIVDSIDEAIDHINKYGTLHSESIITEDKINAKRFQNEVDAACVYVNASTRFTDGEEFGFGAEIGISTQKLHARGPIGLKELVTYKYLISGNGQIRG